MKILLLGSNGQLGSDIQRLYNTKYSNYELIALNRNHINVCNLQNIKPYLNSFQFDILINCISYNQTEECEKNQDQAYSINAFAVKEMAEVCKIKAARLIHFSTDYVFGHHQLNEPLKESLSPSPINVYGTSKLMGENLALSTYNEVLILRTASLFGIAISNSKKDNFVEKIYSAVKKNKCLSVINDIYMSPTSSMDLAQMTYKLIQANAPPGIYHAVNSGQATWFEFAKSIVKQSKISAKLEPISIKEYNSIMQRPLYSVLDNSKIKTIIGNIPNWENALKRYLIEKHYCIN